MTYMPIKMKGTISIVSHGHGRLVEYLLSDLINQHGIESWQIILTLNVPESVNQTIPHGIDVEIIHNEYPKGFGENHNYAAQRAHGPLFLIVNPDIRLPDIQTLQKINDAYFEGYTNYLLAPVVVSSNGCQEDSVRLNLSLPNIIRRFWRRKQGWEADPSQPKFFWLAGMFLVAPLSDFKEVGAFDERYRLYCEDYDLSARWKISGRQINVLRSLTVIHDAQRDSHRSWRHMYWHVTSLLRVWRSQAFWRISSGRYR
jgi:N-acetylglucosaminyl-diphospho-decaprenol L-rhamnosyltransferase